MKKKITFILIVFYSTLTLSNNNVEFFFHYINSNRYDKAKNYLNQIDNKRLKSLVKEIYNLNRYGSINFPKLNLNNSNFENIYLYVKGLESYFILGNEIEAFRNLKASLEISILNNDKVMICETSKIILGIYSRFSQNINDRSYNYFINIYKKNVYSNLEKKINAFYNYRTVLRLEYKNPKKIEPYFIEANKLIDNSSPNFLQAKLLIVNSSYNQVILKNYNLALEQIIKAKKRINSKLGYFEKEKKIISSLNEAILQYKKNNFKLASKLINKVLINESDYIFKNINLYKIFYQYRIHKELGDEIDSLRYKSIFFEKQLKFRHNTSLNLISDIETKYQTEKKEKENLQLRQENLEIESKRKQNRNLLFGSIIILCLGSVIGFLTLKNSRKKRLLAEQQKELETQKNITLLKEQEITIINAMVEGQEKERKRVAEDLHDNLGSVLATLKLHFENLKINQEKKKINQEELFNKTENLIDEAYLKVRRIAHAKNAGVIANQGLLVAIQMMAEKISSADKINIEVIDYGLDKPLENSLEITVFRIIQELTTNIIKHANATKASINISLYDKNLNIIIEDNGKGFNLDKINLKNGMGINSIKTRIEHLKGTFTIDSTINKGSSIIIDIPIT